MDFYKKLNTFLESVKETPFEWGVFDCCLFVNQYMTEVHGKDLMGEFKGRYNDQKSALEALKRYGEGSLVKTMDKKLGRRKKVCYAKRGDIVLNIDRQLGPSLGICVGRFSWFVGEDGLTPLNTKDCVAVWEK